MDLSRHKWNGHVSNSRSRGLGYLTYEQYLAKLSDAGITAEQVGRKADCYHLARRTDKGDYTTESCRFIPHLENLSEKIINGGIESQRQKNKSKTKLNNYGVARQAASIRGRTKETNPELAIRAALAGATMRGRTKHSHSGVARAAEKNAGEFSFVDPYGLVHSGRNINEFCAKHGLLANAMSKLRHGRLKTYKGWTIPHKPLSTSKERQ